MKKIHLLAALIGVGIFPACPARALSMAISEWLNTPHGDAGSLGHSSPAVPESGSLAALFGGLGVFVLRRRRLA